MMVHTFSARLSALVSCVGWWDRQSIWALCMPGFVCALGGLCIAIEGLAPSMNRFAPMLLVTQCRVEGRRSVDHMPVLGRVRVSINLSAIHLRPEIVPAALPQWVQLRKIGNPGLHVGRWDRPIAIQCSAHQRQVEKTLVDPFAGFGAFEHVLEIGDLGVDVG